MVLTANWTEDFYKSEGSKLKNDILTGGMQRDLTQKGVTDVKVTFEILK